MKDYCAYCGKAIPSGVLIYDRLFDFYYCSENCYETSLRYQGRGKK